MRARITLTSVESIAGLEVTRVHDPGTDPEKVLSHALTKLYVARGGAVWEEGEGKQPVRLTAPAELLLDGAAADTPPAPEKDVPKWITANTVNELDQRAAQSVSQALPADRAASLGLMELTEARRKEVRWLAARCLGYLGQFDPMTAALNDVDFRREWPDYVDQLKEAIARGPETAAGIRQSLEKQYGNDVGGVVPHALGLYGQGSRGWRGCPAGQVSRPRGPGLPRLGLWNLQDITHQGLYYQPEATAAQAPPVGATVAAAAKIGQDPLQCARSVKPRSAPRNFPSKKPFPSRPSRWNGVPAGRSEADECQRTDCARADRGRRSAIRIR